MSKLSNRAKRYLALAATLFLIAAITILLKKPSVFEQSVTLEPNESVAITSSSQAFSNTVTKFDFLIPINTPNSKLVEIGNSKDSISVFIIDGRSYVFFVGEGKKDKKFVFDPVDIPLDLNAKNYSFSMEFDDSEGTIDLKTSAIGYVLKLPSVAGFTKIDYLKSLGTTFEYQLNQTTSVKKPALFLTLLICLSMLLLIILRNQILGSARRMAAKRASLKLENKQFALGALAIGLVGMILLPPAPPVGVLTSGEVDLANLSSLSLLLENESSDGGWLFETTPSIRYNPTDYISTLKFEIDIKLDADRSYTEIFAYGVPAGNDSRTRSKSNFKVTMDSKQRISFRLPNQDSQVIFRAKNLTKGVHKLSGQVRNGREYEFHVDGILVYAMSTQDPTFLQVEPNLFISEYALENVITGNVSWEIGAEGEASARFALYRLQVLVVVAALFSSLTLFVLGFLRREKIKLSADINSRKVLRSSIFTFLVLSVLGFVTWLMAFQPEVSFSKARNYPLFAPENRFGDFYQIFLSSQSEDPYSIAAVTYPPFGLLVFDLFGFMSARQALILTMVMALATVASVFIFLAINRNDLSRLEKVGVFSVTTLSFPVVFALDRGNLDLIIVAFLLLALLFNSKQSGRYAAGALIGVASAVKVYPLLLLPIFYYQKREVRTLATSTGIFLLLSAVGAAKYQMNPMDVLNSVFLANSGVETRLDALLRWNGSFAALITTGATLISQVDEFAVWRVMSSTAAIIFMLVIGAGIVLWLAKKAVDTTSFAIVWLSVVSLTFPMTVTYRFTMFLLAFALLLLNGIQNHNNLTTVGILLGVISSPVVYWYFGKGYSNTYSFIVPIATVSIICLILAETIKQSKDRDFAQSLLPDANGFAKEYQ